MEMSIPIREKSRQGYQQHLYEFVLVETEHVISMDELKIYLKINSIYHLKYSIIHGEASQKLSHQKNCYSYTILELKEGNFHRKVC